MKSTTSGAGFDPIPESSYSLLSRSINNLDRNLNNRINQITPIVLIKTAYVGDTQCEFDLPALGRYGTITASVNGSSCEHLVSNNKIIVYFTELEIVSEIKVSIQ